MKKAVFTQSETVHLSAKSKTIYDMKETIAATDHACDEDYRRVNREAFQMSFRKLMRHYSEPVVRGKVS